MSFLKKYFASEGDALENPAAVAFFASLDAISAKSPEIVNSILKELEDQRCHLKLIASENFSSLPVQLAMGNLLTDKYSEGYPGHRFYAGCENVDAVEDLGASLAKKLFNVDHAYIQPHSGADANLVAFWAILVAKIQSKEIERLGKKSLDSLTPEEYESLRQLLVNQRVLGMSLGSGGHLTHGFRHNVSSKMMQAFAYDVDPKTGLIDYAALSRQAKEVKPLILIAGYSAYSRLIDFAKMREIADSVGAILLVDMAHFAGLVAGKVFQGNFDPAPYAHIITSTTHKTLRGPRGGMVLCTNEFKEVVDKGCPLVLGGPLPHVMAAKAIAFQEASTEEFQKYAQQIVKNAQAMSEEFVKRGARVLTGGTENHLFILDVARTFHLTGRQAESLLKQAHLTVNRNAIPHDLHGAWYTSGIRVGTPAVTTLGMGEDEMRMIANIMFDLLKCAKPAIDSKTQTASKAKVLIDEKEVESAKRKVKEILKEYPLYPELASGYTLHNQR